MKQMTKLKSILVLLAISALPMTVQAEDAATNPRVKMSTTLGDFVIELNAEKAPITVKNFISYVEDGYYDGTVFHRVIPTFMIQGGGFDEEMDKKTEGLKPPIKLESSNGLKNVKYSIAMARTGDPNSATSQFFVNVVDNERLDYREGNPGYAAFGMVVDGQEIVDKIRLTECIRHDKYPAPGAVTPKVAVVIKKVSLIKNEIKKESDSKKDGE